jgi:hypothetical protein
MANINRIKVVLVEKGKTGRLKFDIQIVGMPADVNIKYNCKW